MSAEDLSNIGPIALVQDLLLQANLGLRSVERNGHHYFSGLSMFPASVQEAVVLAHPDLYARTPQGWPSLKIDDGEIAIASLFKNPFGVGFELPFEELFEEVTTKMAALE
jgi:hypothetical protein